MRPRDARTFEDVCRLKSSAIDTPDFWMMVDEGGEVCITAQRIGEDKTGQIFIPRKDFTRLVDWYNRDQKLRRKRA